MNYITLQSIMCMCWKGFNHKLIKGCILNGFPYRNVWQNLYACHKPDDPSIKAQFWQAFEELHAHINLKFLEAIKVKRSVRSTQTCYNQNLILQDLDEVGSEIAVDEKQKQSGKSKESKPKV